MSHKKSKKKTPIKKSNRQKNKKTNSKKKRFFWLKRIIGYSFLASLLFVVGYGFYAYLVIQTHFKAQRWNLPSRIYSDNEPLFVGKEISQKELITKLSWLNYRPVNSTPQAKGQYFVSKASLYIFLNDFDYPEKKVVGELIIVEFSQNKIARLASAKTKKDISMAWLEPELIASVFNSQMEDRTFVALENMSDDLINAVVVTEDRRFFEHIGVDFWGILRAVGVNLAKGKLSQGGSTITQQLVKNYFLTSERTLSRKIREAIFAVVLEMFYEKEEILESYLNEIYLGQRGNASIRGVYEASRFYFGKNVSDLSLEEAATLAALIKGPGVYSPFIKPQKSLTRRNLVLDLMVKNDFINSRQAQKAKAKPLVKKPKIKSKTKAPYFVQFVLSQLKRDFPRGQLTDDGLRIFTTLNMTEQRRAQKIAKAHLNSLEKNYRRLKKLKNEGQDLQVAMVGIQPQTGNILIYIGGRDYKKTQFDRVRMAKRAPGSAFKPFVYLAGLENGYHLASLLDDSPLKLTVNNKAWQPQNYDKKFRGPVRFRTSLEKSYNLPAVRLAKDVGLGKVIQTAKKAGIQSKIDPVYSLALGSIGLTPLELLEAYTVFPNEGIATKATSILHVVNRDGQILDKREMQFSKQFEPATIYLMNKLLEGVLKKGTAAIPLAQKLKGVYAGKTGTTSNYKDAWFVGYQPEYLSLVWVGYDKNQSTGLSSTKAALPIWVRYMALQKVAPPATDFIATKEIEIRPIDSETGKLWSGRCKGEKIEEYFHQDQRPQKKCR